MIIHNFEQGSDDWHKIRLGKFTGTNAYPVANQGKGLETLCDEKASEILTGKVNDYFKNEAMERGNELEYNSLLTYEFMTGNTVKQVGFVERNKYIGYSPDGLVNDDGLIEIKNMTNKIYFRYALNRKIKPEHYSQMQYGMMVCKKKWCDYVVTNSNFDDRPIIIVRVYPDYEYRKKICLGLLKGYREIKKMIKEFNKGK